MNMTFKIDIPQNWNYSLEKKVINNSVFQYGEASNSLTLKIPGNTTLGNYSLRVIGAINSVEDGHSAGLGLDEITIEISNKNSFTIPGFEVVSCLVGTFILSLISKPYKKR